MFSASWCYVKYPWLQTDQASLDPNSYPLCCYYCATSSTVAVTWRIGLRITPGSVHLATGGGRKLSQCLSEAVNCCSTHYCLPQGTWGKGGWGCLPTSVCLSVCLDVLLSSFCQSVCLSICMCMHLCMCKFVCVLHVTVCVRVCIL